ncbi:glutamate 5-kinase [Cellulophaga tyrosinoxydans]|uniref:Glutamate 5-kinase n=1 Tax=Cellulophaga tyrosinoxydans TaxID=504486 RepID=A0A1W1Z9Q2_9FLAO|nr:glutamate 5-kinase [Cellulophaga tyrosinoxydans]SMC45125.1 glutamate 5-kinase [Cellulophaga tyrosinoxydans]
MKKIRVLLKVGTNTLTKETNHISRGKIEDIGRQIATLKDSHEFIIVSSGAIAAARQFVKLEHNGEEINVKQALASIGQPHLMRIFQENFRELGLFTSQCLLSYSDFENPKSKSNIKNTIDVLVANNFIPIINENDTVATDEIQFGDNDKLAALTAALLQVDLLLIATNTDGVYTKQSLSETVQETIKEVHNLEELIKEVGNTKSSHGTGGMQSKIEAATIAKNANIETWIINGLKDNFITDAMNNTSNYTKIK